MKRRDALKKTGFIFGGSIAGSTLLFQVGCGFKTGEIVEFFSLDQINFLNEVGETILPQTDTPGAKEANVGAFMAVVVRDCYTPENQKIFIEGMDKINTLSENRYKKSFVACSEPQRTELLSKLDQEEVDYFKLIKNLTLTGYYTSQVGATQFLKYNPAPGYYDGCIAQKPW